MAKDKYELTSRKKRWLTNKIEFVLYMCVNACMWFLFFRRGQEIRTCPVTLWFYF